MSNWRPSYGGGPPSGGRGVGSAVRAVSLPIGEWEITRQYAIGNQYSVLWAGKARFPRPLARITGEQWRWSTGAWDNWGYAVWDSRATGIGKEHWVLIFDFWKGRPYTCTHRYTHQHTHIIRIHNTYVPTSIHLSLMHIYPHTYMRT